MFDTMRQHFKQMQPGDKLVMQIHKSAKPPTPAYLQAGGDGTDAAMQGMRQEPDADDSMMGASADPMRQQMAARMMVGR
jgi:hypothetical protein